jgi:thiol-disulfide isomerase/thioredoxin
MRLATLFISLVSIALLFNGCDKKSSEESLVSTATFNLLDTNGKSYVVEKRGTNFTLDEGKDKVVLFDIFATWCPPCRAEVRHLGNLQKKYGDDLIVMGITIEDDVSNHDLETFKKNTAESISFLIRHKIKISRVPLPLPSVWDSNFLFRL